MDYFARKFHISWTLGLKLTVSHAEIGREKASYSFIWQETLVSKMYSTSTIVIMPNNCCSLLDSEGIFVSSWLLAIERHRI